MQSNPVKLKVTGKIYAGDYLDIQVRSGEAVRIMTGAMIPAGADCVLRQEDTDEGENVVQIYKEVEPGGSICFKGEEYKKVIFCSMQVLDRCGCSGSCQWEWYYGAACV